MRTSIKIYTIWAEKTKLDLEMYEKLTDTAKAVYNIFAKCSEKSKVEQYAEENKTHSLKTAMVIPVNLLAKESQLSEEEFNSGLDELVKQNYFIWCNPKQDVFTYCVSRISF